MEFFVCLEPGVCDLEVKVMTQSVLPENLCDIDLPFIDSSKYFVFFFIIWVSNFPKKLFDIHKNVE